jgi:hypothetical protein
MHARATLTRLRFRVIESYTRTALFPSDTSEETTDNVPWSTAKQGPGHNEFWFHLRFSTVLLAFSNQRFVLEFEFPNVLSLELCPDDQGS